MSAGDYCGCPGRSVVTRRGRATRPGSAPGCPTTVRAIIVSQGPGTLDGSQAGIAERRHVIMDGTDHAAVGVADSGNVREHGRVIRFGDLPIGLNRAVDGAGD